MNGYQGVAKLIKNKVNTTLWDTLNNFCFGYIAVYCFFKNFPRGWWVGWSGWKLWFHWIPSRQLWLWLWTFDSDLGFVNTSIYKICFPLLLQMDKPLNSLLKRLVYPTLLNALMIYKRCSQNLLQQNTFFFMENWMFFGLNPKNL